MNRHHVLFIAFVLLLIWVANIAWSYFPLNERNRRLKYARDPAHHCHIYRREPPYQRWDYGYGGVEKVPGKTFWQCDNDIAFGFNDNEEQP